MEKTPKIIDVLARSDMPDREFTDAVEDLRRSDLVRDRALGLLAALFKAEGCLPGYVVVAASDLWNALADGQEEDQNDGRRGEQRAA